MCSQLLRIEGFLQVGIGTILKRAYAILVLSSGAHHHERYVA